MNVARRFDAVVFDAGGVLVVPTPDVLGPLLAEYGGDGSADAIVRAHYAGMRAQDLHSWDEQSWRVYARAAAASVGVPSEHNEAAATEILTAMRNDTDLWRWPLNDAVRALRALTDAGVAMAVVSNADGQIEATLRREGVCQVGPGAGALMATVVDSFVVGVSKPDPEIFSYALDALGVVPERVIYIGDSVSRDVVGARNAGLHPLHLDPFDDHPDADHDRIRAISDVFDWLG
jgi:HAD superfamily hydrolase (TIGR01509 family)